MHHLIGRWNRGLTLCRPPSMWWRLPSQSSKTSSRSVGWWRRRSDALRKTRPAWKRRSARRRRRRLPTSRWLKRKSTVIPSYLAPVGRPILWAFLHWSPLEMPSPQRRMLSSCNQHPNLKIPWLDLIAPGVRPAWSREGWSSYASPPRATLGPRRMRPHHRSLPFSPSEVLNLSPPSPRKREVG